MPRDETQSRIIVPRRLTPLRWHAEQNRWVTSPARICVVPAGRRSGKTEIAKRRLVKRSLSIQCAHDDPRFFASAPTRDQAKRIYWQDLKKMLAPFIYGKPQETDLIIPLVTGAEVHVFGLDRPERMEGTPWDGGIVDEIGNTKPQAFPENIFPALADRNGYLDMIGVPEGRNHYYDHWKYAISGVDSDWDGFTWPSSDILPPEAIAAMKRVMDDLTFQQECNASFVTFEGRAYYVFSEAAHCGRLQYNPDAPIAFCFDFNVSPGVAAVVQEQHLPNGMPDHLTGTGVIGEVHIPTNSSTPAVCRKLIQDWSKHRGRVICYGDSTGGLRGTAKVLGTDWELIKQELRPVYGDRLSFNVPHNPSERARVNATNSRFRTVDGGEWMMVDPSKAPNVVKDYEGVRLLKGGSGEIDKQADPKLTHLSDGIGYYLHVEFPVVKMTATQEDMWG